MLFLTDQECVEWLKRHDIEVDRGMGNKTPVLRIDLNVSAPQVFAASGLVQEGVGPWNSCLLWVTVADVWPSSTNLHLYYTMRRAYHDVRLLDHAPGHLFLNFEKVDLTTFIHLGLLFGWDMHVLTDMDYGRAFASHDGWADLWRSSESDLADVEETFRRLGCDSKVRSA